MSAVPRVGVLALQGDVREHVAALRTAGAEPVPVRRPEELDGLDGLVLPGGESTTIGRLLRVFELLEPLRSHLGDGLPVYGSCAGMVLLAAEVVDGRPDQPVLGALDVTVRRNAFGSQVESFEADLPLEGVGAVHGVFIRAPWVERTGQAVEVLARVPGGAPAAGRVVAVRQGPVLATSFHPELTGDERVHALFVSMVKEASR
jgi:pyridoxal 5'-phosphate synthase pdxT subunit